MFCHERSFYTGSGLDIKTVRYYNSSPISFYRFWMLKYLQNRCLRPKYMVVYDFLMKNWKKNRCSFLLRGSFYIILGIQNQFSGIQNSKFMKFYTILFDQKSIFIYKNRFLDLKRVSFRPNANTTISGKKGLPTLFARPYIKTWLYYGE
mgnify:CR=1 FL=1